MQGTVVGTFLKPSCGRRRPPIHNIPYSVAYSPWRGALITTTLSDRTYFGYGPVAQAAAWLAGHTEVQPTDLLQLKNYLWNEPGEIEKVQAVLTRLCDDPLRTRLEELLAKAAEMRNAFDTAPDNGKAKALVQLRTRFAGLYREWQALDAGATTDEQHRQSADALNTLEEMSRKVHEACAFTPVPLAQLAVLQSAA